MAKDTRTTTRRVTPSIQRDSIPPAVTKRRTKTMPTEEQIRERAFFIYLARNGGPGDAHSDWVQAERELTREV